VSGAVFHGGAVQIGDSNVQHIHHVVNERREWEVLQRLPEVTPQVGRRQELRQALDWLTPKAGVRGPLVIHGPAGVGKSHLACTIAQEARQGCRFRAGWRAGAAVRRATATGR
jgi:Holliday junction resolvasome RuvABC ATP-dependent DNA helicase subunit